MLTAIRTCPPGHQNITHASISRRKTVAKVQECLTKAELKAAEKRMAAGECEALGGALLSRR